MSMIIIADDDEIVTEVASEAFRSYGHVVGVARNGVEALKAIEAKSPDLVVLDGNMPEMGGVSVINELRKHRAYHDLPVMMLTASAGKNDYNVAMYAGANIYITKPFDADFLVFRAEELIRQHRHTH